MSPRTWKGTQKNVFLLFLCQRVPRLPPPELAAAWNAEFSPRGLPEVTIDTVDYWLKKLKRFPKPEDYRANPAYMVAVEKRNERRGRSCRDYAANARAARRAKLRTIADAALQKNPKLPSRVCPQCREKWPLKVGRTLFFRGREETKRGTFYFFRTACISCYLERQAQLSAERKSGVSAESRKELQREFHRQGILERAAEERHAAEERSSKLLAAKPSLPTATCISCQTVWAVDRQFLNLSPGLRPPKTCRFCDGDYARARKWAHRDGDAEAVAAIERARQSLFEAYYRERRRERREQLISRARELASDGTVKQSKCKTCRQSYPSSLPHASDFWRMTEKGNGQSAIERHTCLCCLAESDSERR